MLRSGYLTSARSVSSVSGVWPASAMMVRGATPAAASRVTNVCRNLWSARGPRDRAAPVRACGAAVGGRRTHERGTARVGPPIQDRPDRRGRAVAVPRGRGLACPVRALRDLRARRELDGNAGSDASVLGCKVRTIARVVKRVAELAGEDPRQFGAHSARAGMLTTASEAGVDLAAVMRQSGHASTSVALGYIRPVEQARNPQRGRWLLSRSRGRMVPARLTEHCRVRA